MTILFAYLRIQKESIMKLWKEVLVTILIGWIVLLKPDDE
jgi:hypothetical protein